MESLLGLLRIHVHRGVNLAVRDKVKNTSDPYVIFRVGKQKVKTRIMKRNLNPEWRENLTVAITDPNLPVQLVVYDKDRFSLDDKMGDADLDIRPFLEALRSTPERFPIGTIIKRIQPNRENCLAEESRIVWAEEGHIVQDMFLRLRNVECGEIHLQLKWVNVPGSRGLKIVSPSRELNGPLKHTSSCLN